MKLLSSFFQAVEISSDFNVYILKRELKEVKRANSASAVVRILLKKVFTAAALNTCSVSGKPSFKDGKMEVRPPLDQDGVEAILGMESNLLLFIIRNLLHLVTLLLNTKCYSFVFVFLF